MNLKKFLMLLLFNRFIKFLISNLIQNKKKKNIKFNFYELILKSWNEKSKLMFLFTSKVLKNNIGRIIINFKLN